ncbi:MAG: helix-turn-helix domain-containing protein [Muribaculaceae bacterium]|nr:helix-turn-helix domain-containing protein [Muribaculaceae bacterium]
MEVLLIEKETLDCILDEHELLCNMVIILANRLRQKETDDLMTSAEVCDFLHIGKTTLQSLRNSGKLGYIRIDDGSVRYPVTEIVRYMEQNGIQLNRVAYGE